MKKVSIYRWEGGKIFEISGWGGAWSGEWNIGVGVGKSGEIVREGVVKEIYKERRRGRAEKGHIGEGRVRPGLKNTWEGCGEKRNKGWKRGKGTGK